MIAQQSPMTKEEELRRNTRLYCGYKHYKNGKVYFPKAFCKIQTFWGKWVDALIYAHEDDRDGSQLFVRELKEFHRKFKLCSLEK